MFLALSKNFISFVLWLSVVRLKIAVQMKQTSWLVLILFFSISSVGAQLAVSSLEVEVLSEDGPLELATVYVANLEIGGLTDDGGVAVLERIPAGEHEIKVSYVGYFSQTQKKPSLLLSNRKNNAQKHRCFFFFNL